MSQRTWQGSGSKYTLSWGNQPWTLELEADRPGMRTVDRPADCVLALDGIAAVSRFDPAAFNGKSLVRVERLAHRVEATYTASRWGGLEVRASWSPTSRHDGIDLEIQVSASSVGELRGLETFVFSQITGPGASTGEPPWIWVRPRDSRSAGFSYDGRVPAADLRRLTTLPLLDSIALVSPRSPPLVRVVIPEGDTWKWCTLTTSRGKFSGDRASRTWPSPGNFTSVMVFLGTTSRRESSFAPGSAGSGSAGVTSPSCPRSPCVTFSKPHRR